MAVTAEQARAELARRELERRRASQPAPEVEAQPSGPTSMGLPDSRLRAITGGLDLLKTLGTGAVGGVAGGIAAAPVAFSDPEAAGQIYDKVSGAITLPPSTEPGKAALGAVAPYVEKADTALTDLAGKAPGGPVVQTALKSAPIAALELSGLRGLGALKPKPSSFMGPPRPAYTVPKVDELFTQGSQAFDRARRLGGGIKAESIDKFRTNVLGLKERSGLGVRINEKLHPQSAAVRQEILNTLDRGDISFDDLIELRQIAADGAGAVDKADARISLLLRKQIDNYVDSLGADDVVGGDPAAAAASLNEARDLWSRASKGKTIDREIELAGINANSYHGAGFENALRTQFKQLSRRIAKGYEPGFTEAEVAMIRKVANGGPVDNLFRWIGKAAPTGIVSGGLAGGAGYLAGGPIGAAAVLGAGAAGRGLATKMTIGNANRASEAVRGGLLGVSPPPR